MAFRAIRCDARRGRPVGCVGEQLRREWAAPPMVSMRINLDPDGFPRAGRPSRCHEDVTTYALHATADTQEHMRTRTGAHGLIPLLNSKIRDTHGHTHRTRADTRGQVGADLKSVQCRFESDWGHRVSARNGHIRCR